MANNALDAEPPIASFLKSMLIGGGPVNANVRRQEEAQMRATADRPETALDGINFLWLEITGKCNLTCTHCYADSGPQGDLYGDMTHADWVRVLDEAAEEGCREVQFIGGEPTMHPRLHDLIDHANHRHYELIEVYTNATRLGKDLVGCFQRNGVQVATSFYSVDPSVHERITQADGSWARTVEGIRRVLEAGLPLRVGVVETELNAGHPAQAVEFLRGMGIENVGIDRQRGVGRGGLIDLGGRGERFDELCGQCWKGKLCVVPSGEAFPCVFSRASPLGSVKAGLATVLRSSVLANFRQTSMEHNMRRFGMDPVACFPTHCEPIECTPIKCTPIQCDPIRCAPCLPKPRSKMSNQQPVASCDPVLGCQPVRGCDPVTGCEPVKGCMPVQCTPTYECNPKK